MKAKEIANKIAIAILFIPRLIVGLPQYLMQMIRYKRECEEGEEE